MQPHHHLQSRRERMVRSAFRSLIATPATGQVKFPAGSKIALRAVGGGGGGVCPVTLSVFQGSPVINGQSISKTYDGTPASHTAITPFVAFWGSGKRVVEGSNFSYSFTGGIGQVSVLIVTDTNRIVLAGYTGLPAQEWVFRLMDGGTISAEVYVAGNVTDKPAVAIDPQTNSAFAYLNGVAITSGAFAPAGMATGWLTGTATAAALDVTAQSAGAGAVTLVTAADDMAHTYEGASDWCGNAIGSGGVAAGTTAATITGAPTRTIKTPEMSTGDLLFVDWVNKGATVTPQTGFELLVHVGLGVYKKVSTGA